MPQRLRFTFQLQVSFIREGNKFIAYSPALDIATSGQNITQAKKRFEELVRIFFSELHKKKTLDKALTELGWERKGSPKQWVPPTIVSTTTELVRV